MLQEIVEDKKRKNTFDHVAKYLDKQMPKILMLNKKWSEQYPERFKEKMVWYFFIIVSQLTHNITSEPWL